MEKNYLNAVELLEIASQHAYCAEYLLLDKQAEITFEDTTQVDALLPAITLIHMAFELTLKAYLLHQNKPLHQHAKLTELIELNHELDLTQDDIKILKNLSMMQSVRKGVDYLVCDSRESLHVFCEKGLSLFTKLLEIMPLELQKDYQR